MKKAARKKKPARKRTPRRRPDITNAAALREDAFVAALLDGTGRSGTEAATIAGYSARRADVASTELLQRPSVQAKIAARQAEIKEKTGITETAVLHEAELLAFSNIEHYVQNDAGILVLAEGAPPDAMRAVSSVKYRTVTSGSGKNERTERIVEFRLWDKPGMVKILGRHVGAKGFADRVEVTGKDGAPIDLKFTLKLDNPNADV